MDVLRPPVKWINGRCYRKLPFERNSNFDSSSSNDPYQEHADMMYEDEVCENLVHETPRGFMTELNDVPSALFKFVVGKGGETKRRIEGDTNTRISIPGVDKEGSIEITGPHKAGVLSARSRVTVIAESSRQKISPTDFICFPLYFDGLATKVVEFKKSVLEQLGEDKGIHPSIFQAPTKLHLTVGVLRLLTEDEVSKASAFLQSSYKELVRDLLGDKPVFVKLQGVEYMNDDPTSVTVLYAKVIETDGTQRLQNFANSLMNKFVDHGLMMDEYGRVKLHATLMNSGYHAEYQQLKHGQFSDKKPRGPRPSKKKYAFDVTNLVELYKDFDFGTYQLNEIHLSLMGSSDAEGQYICQASVPLP